MCTEPVLPSSGRDPTIRFREGSTSTLKPSHNFQERGPFQPSLEDRAVPGKGCWIHTTSFPVAAGQACSCDRGGCARQPLSRVSLSITQPHFRGESRGRPTWLGTMNSGQRMALLLPEQWCMTRTCTGTSPIGSLGMRKVLAWARMMSRTSGSRLFPSAFSLCYHRMHLALLSTQRSLLALANIQSWRAPSTAVAALQQALCPRTARAQ